MTLRNQHAPGTIPWRTHLMVCTVALLSLQVSGCDGLLPFPFEQCLPPPNPDGELLLRGKVIDADTLEGMRADIAAQLLTEGVVTTRDLGTYLADEDGSFSRAMIAKGPDCATVPDLSVPDQLNVIVTVEGCGQTFLIDINEDTVVDPTFPDRVIELKEPILVTACEE